MLHRVRSLVTVLALGLPALAAADRAPPRRPTPISVFLTQDKYTYCDAKTLSGLWKQSVGDAKTRVGMKIQAGSTTYLDGQIAAARKAALKDTSQPRCTFFEMGLTYPDAERLAKLWKSTPEKAKSMAEDKVLMGNEKLLMQLVAQPSVNGARPPVKPAKKEPIDYFFDSDTYTYCDAKQLAQLWKSSVEDGKTTIGMKISSKSTSYLDEELARARKQKNVVHCDYVEAGLSYEDVEKLAKKWKTTVDKAKATIEIKATTGGAKALRDQLKPATMTPPPIKPPPPPTKPATKK